MKKHTIPMEDSLLKFITDPEMRQLILKDAEAANISVDQVILQILDEHIDENGESCLQFGNLN